MCDHQNAVCVDTTPASDEGRFYEKYECLCGAEGVITGKEQDPPAEWHRSGEVFADD